MSGPSRDPDAADPVGDGRLVQDLLAFASLAGKGLLIWDRDLRLVGRNAEVAELTAMPLDQFPLGVESGLIEDRLRKAAEEQGREGFWPLQPLASFEDALHMVALDSENIGRIGPGGAAEVRVQRMILGESYLLTVLTDMLAFNPLYREDARQRVYLDTMFQNITDGAMLMDHGDRIIACNRRMFELYGIDETLFEPGMQARDFVRLNGDLALIDQWAERERVIDSRTALITGKVATGDTVHFERRLANGTCLQITRTALSDGAGVITVRDSTESAELARQRHLFRTVIENINDGVSLIDRDGHVQVVNNRMLELYQINPGSIVEGMHVERFARASGDLEGMSPEARAEEVRSRVGFATTRARGTLTRMRKMHNGRTLHLVRTALQDGAAVTTYRDITQEIERTKLLAEAKASAEEASSLKSDFLARVTHELRTPMNGVLGMAALLDHTDLDEKQRQFLDVLMRSGRHMVDLIDSLLTVATHESDGLNLEPEPVCLHDLCAQCVEMVRPRAVERGLALSLLANSDVPPKVMADPTRLTQILVNLLQNAVKFTEDGRVELHLQTQREDTLVTARIEVRDTGVGIDEDKLDEIFLKFAQVGGTAKKLSDGVGLGLSIARSLAEMMGGTLSAKSRPGKGSAFVLNVAFPEANPLRPGLTG